MDALFETYAILTLQEFKKQFWTLYRTRSIITVMVVWIGLLMMYTGFYMSGTPFNLVLMVVYVILIPLIEYVAKTIMLKKIYQSNQSAQNVRIQFRFYNDYFTKESDAGHSKTEYHQLYKIIETKTRFYLMIGNNGGYILVKENFPEGLAEFLRDKQKELKRK